MTAPRTHALVRWFPLLLGFLASGSCTPPPPTPGFDALLAALAEPVAGGEEPVAAARPRLLIYLDASQSMQGFLNLPNSRFRRALDHLLDRSIAGGYDVTVFKFDRAVERLPPTASVASIARVGFFVGAETSFPALFQHIDRERKPGTIAVVVTDLVQSGTTGDQKALSEAFQRIVQRRPEVLLVALRSPFVGAYWPEFRPTARLQLDLRGQDARSSRPFYLLAIADRAEELEILRRHLDLTIDEESTSEWAIDASRPGVVVREVHFAPPADGPDAVVWQIHRRPEELPRAGRTPRKVFWLYEQKPPRNGSAPVRFRLATEGEIGVADLGDIVVQVRRCPAAGDGPCSEPETLALPVPVQLTDARELLVSLPLPRPAPGAWEAYKVQILPGRANLSRPIDPELWTTDDDADPRNATRTYKLDLFVDTLVNTLREPVAFAEQYIFLGRGE